MASSDENQKTSQQSESHEPSAAAADENQKTSQQSESHEPSAAAADENQKTSQQSESHEPSAAAADENQKTSQQSESHEPSAAAAPPPEEETKKWGTHIMGEPAAPTVHPDNQQAALWQAQGPQHYYLNQQQPYVMYSPVQKTADNPFEYVVNTFNFWSHKAEEMGRNIWQHLKTGPSLSGAAWGKVNLTAKALTEGGFESLFKQIFQADPSEKLKKTFACYLSTTTGPVAGTLYLSTARVAFCSDRPLSFRAPSGQEAWSYYKVAIPLGQIENVNPVIMRQEQQEKYIHIVTVDGHEFWFMGFVNFEKASHHLLDSVSDFRAGSHAAQPVSGQEVIAP